MRFRWRYTLFKSKFRPQSQNMKEISQKDVDYAALILRVTVGIFFAVAGLAQLANIAAGFVDTFSGFAIVVNAGTFGNVASSLLPWVELILGVLLIAGLGTSVVATVVAFLSFVFAAQHGFTSGVQLTQEILFVAAGLALMLLGGGNISLDGKILGKK